MISLSAAVRRWSIRRKLLVIILVTIWLATSIAAALYIAYYQHRAKQELDEATQVMTTIFARRTAAALAFRDHKATRSNLDSLKLNANVSLACLYQQDGRLFDHYASGMQNDGGVQNGRGVQNSGGMQISRGTQNSSTQSLRACPASLDEVPDRSLDGDFLRASEPVLMREQVIGRFMLWVSLAPIQRSTLQFTLISVGIQIVSCLLAYFLSLRMQRSITDPIVNLSVTARQIRQSNDYSARAERVNEDEVGDLVTAFNAMLHRIQQSNIALNDLIIELQESQRSSEQKALSASEKSKTIREFFAGASHDLRQPLHAMGMFIDAIKAQPMPDEQRQLVQKLDQSRENMTALFTDLLDLSKLEARLSKPQLKHVKLKPLLASLVTEFEVLAQDKNLRLVIHLRDLTARSDAQMFERVIRNLLSNAIRYTERGGIVLAVRPHAGKIAVEVWDSGRGIDASQQQSIYEQYIQLEERDAESGGFGLGLSIVKRLCDLLGHTLQLRSAKNRGTRFRLLLEPASEPARSTQVQALQPDAMNPLQGKNVLVVDDEPDVLDAMSAILHGWGMGIYQTTHPAQAKQAVLDGQFDPDIILSDYRLGEITTGDRFLCELFDELGYDIPAILITGESDESSLSAIAASGFRVLNKPVKAARLRSLMLYAIR